MHISYSQMSNAGLGREAVKKRKTRGHIGRHEALMVRRLITLAIH